MMISIKYSVVVAIIAVYIGIVGSVLADAVASSPGRSSAAVIKFRLAKAGYVTLVIDDSKGNRVRNLVSETLMPAGENTVVWDGYDDGVRSSDQDGDVWGRDLTRHLVGPGIYTVRGLVRDRLVLRYQLSVNSPGTPPWKTADSSGEWLADHSPPGDILYIPGGVVAPNGKGLASFLVCSTSGESGEEFVWLDRDGKRLYGTNTGFWGGTHLARDPGQDADRAIVPYVFTLGERDLDNNTIDVRAIRCSEEIANAVRYTFPLSWKSDILPQFKSMQEAYGADGFAVYDRKVVFSVTQLNRIFFADSLSRRIISQVPDASPRGLCFGKKHSIIARLDGLGSVVRSKDQTISLSSDTLRGLPDLDVSRVDKDVRKSLDVTCGVTPFKADGDLSIWPKSAAWVQIDARSSASVTVQGNTFYAAWRTGDPPALSGGPGDFRFQFKRGGALDLMIGSVDAGSDPRQSEPEIGDERLLVTMVGGKPLAVLSRQVAPDDKAKNSVVYQSPIGTVAFDPVLDVSDQVTVARKAGYFEIST